MDVFFINAAPV